MIETIHPHMILIRALLPKKNYVIKLDGDEFFAQER